MKYLKKEKKQYDINKIKRNFRKLELIQAM